MKNQNKGESTAPVKLPVEQLEVLRVVNANKCNARQLDKLLWYCRPLEADDFAQDLFECVGIVLSSVDELNAQEVAALSKLFEFARVLEELPMATD